MVGKCKSLIMFVAVGGISCMVLNLQELIRRFMRMVPQLPNQVSVRYIKVENAQTTKAAARNLNVIRAEDTNSAK